MKVHITLRKTDRTPDAVGSVVRVGRLRDVNEPRALRWGVITAEVEPDAVEAIRSLPQVEAVEIESTKHTA